METKEQVEEYLGLPVNFLFNRVVGVKTLSSTIEEVEGIFLGLTKDENRFIQACVKMDDDEFVQQVHPSRIIPTLAAYIEYGTNTKKGDHK